MLRLGGVARPNSGTLRPRIPAATGIAILWYRLYDVDLVDPALTQPLLLDRGRKAIVP